MKKMLCKSCGVEGFHNPTPPKGLIKEPGYRCCNCGVPGRTGNLNPKNIVEKRWNGVFFGGYLEKKIAEQFKSPAWTVR